jgi:hypothetical protein
VQLVDSTVVVFSDSDQDGRVVSADIVTGLGWEFFSPAGADGPGELGGRQPWVITFHGSIHGLTNQQHIVWNRDGEVVSSRRYEQPWLVAPESRFFVGIAGNRVVVQYWQTAAGPEWQELGQGFRIYDVEQGLVADVTEGIPRHVSRWVRQAREALNTETRPGTAFGVAARGETIVWWLSRQTRVTILDPGGARRTSREIDQPIEQLFIDGDQRIWAKLASKSANGEFLNIVLDRNLNELFRIAATNVMDAFGDYLLALKRGELGSLELVLLRMRRGD